MTKKLDNAIGLYMEGIRDGKAREAITRYTGDRYTQHSTGVADGVEGFVAFFESFLERNPERDIRVVRAIEDGQHVFCQVTQSLNGGPARWLTTDLFDTDAQDRIIEHWDVISEWKDDRQLDGPTEVTDLQRTAENKACVEAMTSRALIGGELAALGEWVADDLIQHELDVDQGLAAWQRHLVGESGRARVHYREQFRLIGQGNFVVTYCAVDVGSDPYAIFDLYRLHSGRIVERWTNAEIIPADTGNSGKF